MADQGDPGTPDKLFHTLDTESTENLAAELYRGCFALFPELLVLLYGELGAGKTAFCRGLGRAMGITETINSPSYNLLNMYRGESHELYHYDLYRLQNGEFDELEFIDYWKGTGKRIIHAIEWPERYHAWPGRLPLHSLHFGIVDGGREIIWKKSCSS